MKHQSNNAIIYITTCVLISLLMACGEDNYPLTITPNYLPIEVGNTWIFVMPDNPHNTGDISITGTTLLANGKTVFTVSTTDDYGHYDSGYLSRAANDLLLFHKTLKTYKVN